MLMTQSASKKGARRLLAGFAVWFLFFLCTRAASAESLPTAPAWTLKDTAGRTLRLADYRGKVVILNFWATWCPYCRQEIPGFTALQEKYGPQGLVVIGVAMDEEPKLVAPYARKAGINYPIVYGTPLVTLAYGDVPTLPTTFVIRRDGKIALVSEVAIDARRLESEIKSLL